MAKFETQGETSRAAAAGSDIHIIPRQDNGVLMSLTPTLTAACGIMEEFAGATGLQPPLPGPERYLWTDAFAVCTYCGLYETTADRKYYRLALMLVDQVHHTLGRHRSDDRRSGWISGLADDEGGRHPTTGGLRIGKPLPERGAGDPLDELLEWDRDGQYFHYLTKWMHALNRVGAITGDPACHAWAVELALAAHAGFMTTSPGRDGKTMHWKMSIDLTRPLVPSMGQHDPLDGYVTCRELLATGAAPDPEREGRLKRAAADYAALCKTTPLLSGDPLGVGGLMADAGRIAQIIAADRDHGLAGILQGVLHSACRGMEIVLRQGTLALPADYRLGFRELGLSIGLSAIQTLSEDSGSNPFLMHDPVHRYIGELAAYLPVKSAIERFWMESRNRSAATWTDHRWINEVMLATSLAPEGFLSIGAPGS